MLDEPLTWRMVVGALIAFTGVGVLAMRGKTVVESTT
jgi:hypothetical protein